MPRDQFIREGRRLGFEYWRASNCNHDYLNFFYDDEGDARHYVRGYEPEVQTQLALEYLDSHEEAEGPWALWLNYSTPHPPYLRMPEAAAQRARARAAEITLRPNVTEFSDDKFDPPPGHYAYPLTPERRKWQPRYDSEEQLRENIAGYYGHIEALDREIGRLLRQLRLCGALDDTIIVYFERPWRHAGQPRHV